MKLSRLVMVQAALDLTYKDKEVAEDEGLRKGRHIPFCNTVKEIRVGWPCVCMAVLNKKIIPSYEKPAIEGTKKEEPKKKIKKSKPEVIKEEPQEVKLDVEEKLEESVSSLIQKAEKGNAEALEELKQRLIKQRKEYLVKGATPRAIIQAAEVVFEILPNKTEAAPIAYSEEKERLRTILIVGANDEIKFLKQLAFWARVGGWQVEVSAYETLTFSVTDVLLVFKRQVPEDKLVVVEGMVQAKVYSGTKATSEYDFLSLLKYLKKRLKEAVRDPK